MFYHYIPKINRFFLYFLTGISLQAAQELGSNFQFEFAEMDHNGRLRTFSQTAPDWRIVSQGFNMEGQCLNDECKAYKKFVWSPLGFGPNDGFFDIVEMIYDSPCPMCTQPIDNARSCGFYRCHYHCSGKKIIGQKEEEEIKIDITKKFDSKGIADSKKGLLYFSEKDGLAVYRTLFITCKKI